MDVGGGGGAIVERVSDYGLGIPKTLHIFHTN